MDQETIDNHYVYFHHDPIDNSVMYVGCGTGFRAWTVATHRSREHQYYLECLMNSGYLPCDWVSIEKRQLSKVDAHKLEREFIQHFKPLYNKRFGEKLMKLSLEQLNQAKERRTNGEYYRIIAEDLGVSTMTLHRALNGGSPRYEELLNDKRIL